MTMTTNNRDTTQLLKTCAEELNNLGPDTEQEFLGIGESLHKLADICFTMTSEAVKLTALSSFQAGEESTQDSSFIEETRTIFNDVGEQVQTTINSLNEGEHLLVAILEEVKRLKAPVQELGGIGKTFKVLGINIKVESSRNEKTREGFKLLAEEVADISKLVKENCKYCSDKTDGVVHDISASMRSLKGSNTQYGRGEERIIHNILDALKEVGDKAESLAMGIKERSTVMTQGIGEVVMAMQFHDISRQQLENVAKALLESKEKVQIGSNGTLSAENEVDALEVYGILNIQAAHLNSIYEQILRAKQQIETGLRTTMEQSAIQAEDAGTLLKVDGSGSKQSIVSKLEDEIENIVIALNSSLQVVGHAAEVSKGVYDDVSGIGEFVHKLEGIAFDVKILAINAMVEAIRTGDAGRTLTVLAQELSNLSKETRIGATDSIKMLQDIMERTEKQVKFATDLNMNREAIDTMIEQAKTLTGTILSSMEEVNGLAKKMGRDSRDLSSQINKLVPGIRFPVVMGERIEQNWQIICDVIENIEESYPQFTQGNPEVEKMMEKLSQKYVMDRERSIHAQVAGGEYVATESDSDDFEMFGDDDGFELFDDDAGQEADDTKKKEQEFDDNVELF